MFSMLHAISVVIVLGVAAFALSNFKDWLDNWGKPEPEDDDVWPPWA